MAVTTVEDRRAHAAAAAALPFLVAGGLYLVVLLAGANLLNDPDIYWHLVVGDWIVAHGFPTGDPFSFTFAGEPWIAKEWLSQIVFALAHRLGGWPLVVVVAATAIAFAFGLLTWFVGERLAPLPTLALVAAAFALAAPHFVARPHVLALPVLVAWVGGLVRAVDHGRRPSFLLIGLMVLWANLHGGFTLGLVLCAAAGLDAVAGADPAERRRLAPRWLAFTGLAVVAASITPYGPESMLVTYRILSQSEALSIITEWRPPDLSRLTGFEVVLLAAVGLALYRGFVLPPVRVLVILGLLHLALSAMRNGELLGLVAPLFVAAPLARQFPAAAARHEPTTVRHPPAAVALVAVLGAAVIGLAATRDAAPNPRITPADAVAAIGRTDVGRVFNDYDFGGYLVFAGVPPFIDGRTELYGGTFTARHDRAVNLADLDDFVRMLDDYRIGATLLAPATPAVALLDRLPGWRRLHADDIAVVHVRTAL